MYGQFSKFIRPGAVRVWSEAAAASHPSAAHVHHVAFTDGSGGHDVVVVIDGEQEVRVQLQWQRFRLGRVWGLRDDCHLVNAVGARWWEAEVKSS